MKYLKQDTQWKLYDAFYFWRLFIVALGLSIFNPPWDASKKERARWLRDSGWNHSGKSGLNVCTRFARRFRISSRLYVTIDIHHHSKESKND